MPGIGGQDRGPRPARGRRRLELRSAHLAAYTGVAPVTRSSGSSIKGEHPARTGNRKLERAFLLAAFVALSDPTSNAALIRLARRRYDVRYAMLRTGTPSRLPPQPRLDSP